MEDMQHTSVIHRGRANERARPARRPAGLHLRRHDTAHLFGSILHSCCYTALSGKHEFLAAGSKLVVILLWILLNEMKSQVWNFDEMY